MDVGYPGGAIIYKSTEKLFFDSIIISKQVVEVTYNARFIFAKQIVTDQTLDTNYYFIDKLNGQVYGPLTLDSSKKVSNRLKIRL
jgi:hypothetical protein